MSLDCRRRSLLQKRRQRKDNAASMRPTAGQFGDRGLRRGPPVQGVGLGLQFGGFRLELLSVNDHRRVVDGGETRPCTARHRRSSTLASSQRPQLRSRCQNTASRFHRPYNGDTVREVLGPRGACALDPSSRRGARTRPVRSF